MGYGDKRGGRWEGRLTPMCPPSSVKVDKDRQMVVLEEEFQVRGWGDGTSKKGRVGLGDPSDCD